VPGLSRVAALWTQGTYVEHMERDMLKGAEVAARALGIGLQFVEARGPVSSGVKMIENQRIEITYLCGPFNPRQPSMPPCSGQSRPSPAGGRKDAASLDSPCAPAAIEPADRDEGMLAARIEHEN